MACTAKHAERAGWQAWGLALLLLMSGVAAPAGAERPGPAAHKLDVDDVLHLSVFGQAAFSPDGNWLAYNATPPYDSLKDYSYWLYAYGLSGHRLWVREVAGEGRPRLQPGLDTEATNYLAGFSPDSRSMVVLEHRTGRLRFVACRVGTADCIRFEGEPDFRDGYFTGFGWNERLEWVTDHSFIMPVRPDGLPGSERHSRGLVGQYLWSHWNEAWQGEMATASEMISTGRDRSEDWAPGTLMEFDLAGGAARRIASGRYAGARASPDGHYIIAARVGERVRPPADVPPQRHLTHPRFDRRYALCLIDRTSGEVKPAATPFNIDPGSIVWSAGGNRFAVFGWQEGETQADGQFYVFDPGTLRARPMSHAGLVLADRHLAPEPAYFSGPAGAALLDAGPAVFARPEQGGPFGWYLLRQEGPKALTEGLEGVSGRLLGAAEASLTVLSPQGVYRIDASGTSARLTPEPGAETYAAPYEFVAGHSWSGEFRFNSPARRSPTDPRAPFVLARGHDGTDKSVFFTGGAKTRSRMPVLETGLAGGRVLAASELAAAALATRREGSSTELILLRDGHAPQLLARINAALDATLPVPTRPIRYNLKDPAGIAPPRAVDGCLLLPPDYRPGERYPVVLDLYPTGLAGSCATLRDAPRPGALVRDLWTSRGFVYFRPPMPLDLARTADGPIAGMPGLADQAVEALVTEGIADPERIVLAGFSQGGVASLYVAAKSDRFAAVISINGWADYLSHYFGGRGIAGYLHLDQNGGDNRWRYDCLGEGADNSCPFGFDATPFDDPGRYTEESPVILAQTIDVPVLLVHSDMDYFSMSQYDEMFGALYRAGKEARYVRYWGEGHGPSSPANIRDLWCRIDRFLMENGVMEAGEALSSCSVP